MSRHPFERVGGIELAAHRLRYRKLCDITRKNGIALDKLFLLAKQGESEAAKEQSKRFNANLNSGKKKKYDMPLFPELED